MGKEKKKEKWLVAEVLFQELKGLSSLKDKDMIESAIENSSHELSILLPLNIKLIYPFQSPQKIGKIQQPSETQINKYI